MDYRVACPHCQSGIAIMASQVGREMRCPFCQRLFQVGLAPAGGPHIQMGRPFSFPCGLCGSRLEAFTGMVGRRGQCPTCGAEFVIPASFGKGQRVGGTEPENEYAQPVHAYAAAGDQAPRIVRTVKGERAIECPRCKQLNEVARNNCRVCAMPFTLEGAEGGPSSAGSGLSTASLVLGIIGLPAMCIIVPSVLAVIFGVLSMRGQTASDPAAGRRSSVAGIVLGIIGVLLFVVYHVAF